MTTTCKRAILSLLECARHNAVEARKAESAGHHRMANYRRTVSCECAADARALRKTARLPLLTAH
jgi:hypothetical protein